MRATFGVQVLVAVVILTLVTYVGWIVLDNVFYRQQAQPIAFPHDLHAGQRQIACQYCHRGVNHADIAGVPSVQECMDCHQAIPKLLKESVEVQKLKGYWDRKEPIKWFKVYQLPEHVRFSHQAHIARGFDCAYCHGQVQEMKVLKFPWTSAWWHSPGTMGWCLQCHRDNKGPQDCSACHK
ncbi:MAG: cytochrome c3 family protein [Armatimonadetes bacterium]|nr:cytochrome c3 family protein [Armatimonadota bacterium]